MSEKDYLLSFDPPGDEEKPFWFADYFFPAEKRNYPPSCRFCGDRGSLDMGSTIYGNSVIVCPQCGTK